MANVKNGAFRESIIDRCLRNRRGYSTQEIMDTVNDALYARGYLPVTSANTIRNDIFSIETRWHVNVEEIRIGREKRYRYEDSNFSIFNSPLNDEEIEQLSQSVSLLRRFEGMPGFEWVEEMSAHLQSTVGASAAPVIGFDENKLLKGMSLFTPLFNAITKQKTIKIKYVTYKGKEISDVVYPYYLKEYNRRWFLIALTDSFKMLSNFALDRIESIEESNAKYIPNTEIDFAHYFDNIIGVSADPSVDIQEVKIKVDKEQLPYVLSKPIHKSQTLIEECPDGDGIIAIRVKPNFELMQCLHSFGKWIEILSPKGLREEISTNIEQNLAKYK